MITFRNLNKDEIEVRVGTCTKDDKGGAKVGMQALLYQDSRAAMVLLDETVGPENWQRKHEFKDGKLYCSVGIRITRDDGTADWVWKEDVGTESNTEAEKGQASDAFKRAVVNWGVARALYTSPFIWITGCDKYDKFQVEDIGYKDGTITKLRISCTKGERKGQVVFESGYGKSEVKSKTVKSNDKTDAEIKKSENGSGNKATMTREEALAIETDGLTLKHWYTVKDTAKIDALRRTGNEKMKEALRIIDEWIKENNANKNKDKNN